MDELRSIVKVIQPGSIVGITPENTIKETGISTGGIAVGAEKSNWGLRIRVLFDWKPGKGGVAPGPFELLELGPSLSTRIGKNGFDEQLKGRRFKNGNDFISTLRGHEPKISHVVNANMMRVDRNDREPQPHVHSNREMVNPGRDLPRIAPPEYVNPTLQVHSTPPPPLPIITVKERSRGAERESKTGKFNDTPTFPRKQSVTEEAWVKSLLQSEMFAAQKKRLSGRMRINDKTLQDLVTTLASRGGSMTIPALARVLEVPEHRLPGFLAVMQRLLNIDGYSILDRQETANTVILNVTLLKKQFELDERGINETNQPPASR